MAQDLCKVGIIGAGPAGCCCAYFGANSGLDITLIEYQSPLSTILPTGGGRCNLAHAEWDFRELAKNYPRGEKFLYSVFSRFATSETIEMFEKLGVDTYIQEDNRIFPRSNSAKDVREKFLQSLKQVKFVKEKALRIEVGDKFKVVTDMNSYYFDKLVIATGSHNGFEMVERIGVTVNEVKPSLVGLVTAEKFSSLMGTALKNVKNCETGLIGDILFTHFGMSGPLIYKISAINAYSKMPYELHFDLSLKEFDLQELFNSNPHKYIKNLLAEIVPARLAGYILEQIKLNPETKCHAINSKIRDLIDSWVHNFKIKVKSTQKDGETVNAGGIELDKINSKSMESKEIPNLYFCGEVIDVDGFCGGFNLQNCWSTAYIVAQGLSAQ